MEQKPIKKKLMWESGSNALWTFFVLVIVKPNIKINIHNVKTWKLEHIVSLHYCKDHDTFVALFGYWKIFNMFIKDDGNKIKFEF